MPRRVAEAGWRKNSHLHSGKHQCLCLLAWGCMSNGQETRSRIVSCVSDNGEEEERITDELEKEGGTDAIDAHMPQAHKGRASRLPLSSSIH